MEELFKVYAGYIALGVEIVAALVIAYGAAQAIINLFRPERDTRRPFAQKRHTLLHFGVWLIFALQFELAADIVRSAIAPSWTQIGQLATIAVIRTFLNYFLEKDVDKLAGLEETKAA